MSATTLAPAAAPVAPAVPVPAAAVTQVFAGGTITLSKAELIAGIRVALTIVTDDAQRKGLEYALQLAQKLEG